MSADYKPGTVAMVTNGDEQLLAFRVSWPAEDWMSVDDGSLHAVSEVRPLVVLDPDDREQVERLAEALNESLDFRPNSVLAEAVAAALRDTLCSLSKPPKPAEPQGLGAVVEDTEGKHFVRIPDGDDHDVWFDNRGDFFAWESIDVVRVLSEGVQP